MYSCGKDCQILIPFRVPQISHFPFCLKCFSSDSDSCPNVGIGPTKGRGTTNTPVSPPSSFILPSFAWIYIFFSPGQVLLSALSWCSACTFVSEGIFLMYLWREMYSTSTYSSTILFSTCLFYIGLSFISAKTDIMSTLFIILLLKTQEIV